MSFPLIQTGGAFGAALAHFNGMQPNLGLTLGQVIEPTTISASDGSTLNYTVPAGFRAVLDLFVITFSSTATETVQLRINIGGTWFSCSGNTTTVVGSNAPAQWITPFSNICPIFEAGDVIDVKGSAGGISIVYGSVYLFPNTAVFKTPRLIGTMTVGDNLIYTVPTGKNAILVPPPASSSTLGNLNWLQIYSASNITDGAYRLGNGVSAPTTVKERIVPNNTMNASAQSVQNNTFPLGSLSAGESVDIRLTGPSFANFTLSAVANASAGSTVYTGSITGGTTNALAGGVFYIEGFKTAANNGLFTCSASTTTTITVNNASGVSETKAGQATMAGIPLTAAANASGGNTVYNAPISKLATNSLLSWAVTITGFSTSANNGSFTVVSSTTTTITVNNPSGVLETKAALLTCVSIPTALWLSFIYEF